MKFLAKVFLSKFSTLNTFFDVLEKIYQFAIHKRFHLVSRPKLLLLKQHLSPNIVSPDFDLIRVGSKNDGGYVMFPPTGNKSKVISLGIADNLDFELDLIDSNRVQAIYCYDGSITKLPESREGIFFTSKFVKNTPAVNAVQLEDIIDGIQAEELILKIDIEGDEWEVLREIDNLYLKKFSQILIEFHGLASSCSDSDVMLKVNLLMKLQEDFFLFNTHPNNWSKYRIIHGIPIYDVAEISFINKDHLASRKSSFEFVPPIIINESLNSPCNPLASEYSA